MATTVGLFLDNLLLQYVLNAPLAAALNNSPANGLSLPLFLILMAHSLSQGLLVGGLQWVVLSRYVRQARWWVLASILGWAIFSSINFGYLVLAKNNPGVAQAVGQLGPLGYLLVFELVTGLVVGLVQWTAIRSWGRGSLLWVLIVISMQIVSVLVLQLRLPSQVSSLLAWITEGAVTGLGIAYLLNAAWPALVERDQTAAQA